MPGILLNRNAAKRCTGSVFLEAGIRCHFQTLYRQVKLNAPKIYLLVKTKSQRRHFQQEMHQKRLAAMQAQPAGYSFHCFPKRQPQLDPEGLDYENNGMGSGKRGNERGTRRRTGRIELCHFSFYNCTPTTFLFSFTYL